MEIKVIKVEKVEWNREWLNPNTNKPIHYFNMECVAEGGIELIGQFSTLSKNQTKFLIGEEYEVNLESKTNNNGEYLFFTYTEEEQKKRKESREVKNEKKSTEYKYVRPRPEILSIISQSSYEAAAIAAIKIAPDKITNHQQIADISLKLCQYITDQSGLNSVECKNGVKLNLKEANEKSIVYQKALKIAVQLIDLKLLELPSPLQLKTTAGIIALTDLIVNDINKIAGGF